MTLPQVKEFNETFGVRMLKSSPIPETHSAAVRVPEARLRFRLIKEELHEFLDAVEDCDIVELLDALGDIEYVVDGAALVFGLTGTMTRSFNALTFSGTEVPHKLILNKVNVEIVLEDLRIAILRNNAERVGELLGFIKALTYNSSFYYNVCIPEAVDAIHTSNMSKLGEDGKPIYREEDSKVLKGPSYKTPTDDLHRQLFGEHYVELH